MARDRPRAGRPGRASSSTYPQVLRERARAREGRLARRCRRSPRRCARVEARARRRTGRLLVRYSGTEPLLRVMLEGQDAATRSSALGARRFAERRCSDARSSSEPTIRVDRWLRLSVNVNKVATLRNSRGGRVPSVLDAVRRVRRRPARPGITVHPRADERHITPADVREIAERARAARAAAVEFNIEGDPRPGPARRWCSRCGPTSARSCRCCPARSRARPAGRPTRRAERARRRHRASCRRAGVRVSLFVDPEPARDPLGRAGSAPIASSSTPSRSRARSSAGRRRRRRASRATPSGRELAHELGLGVNAGHDLDLRQPRAVPHACRTSTRCRSATRSSATRCSSACGQAVREYLAAVAGRTPRMTATRRSRRPRVALAARRRGGRAGSARRAAPSRCRPPTASPWPARSTRRRRGRRPACVLVHMLVAQQGRLGRGRRPRCRHAGITALAIDLRGHGGSAGSVGDDLAGAWRRTSRPRSPWLAGAARACAPAAIGVVGASLGANLAAAGRRRPAAGAGGRAALAGRSTTAGCASMPPAAQGPARRPMLARRRHRTTPTRCGRVQRTGRAEPPARENSAWQRARPRHPTARPRPRPAPGPGGLVPPDVAILRRSPCAPDSIVFGIAGVALRPHRRLGHRQPAGRSGRRGRPRRWPQAAPRRQRPERRPRRRRSLDETSVKALADRRPPQNPKDAQPRVQLGNLYFDAERYAEAIKWYEQAMELDPNDAERQHRSRRRLLLHEPARPRARAVRALAEHRSEAHQDAAERGHRPAFGKQDLDGAAKAWEQVVAHRARHARRAGGQEGRSTACKHAHPAAPRHRPGK